MGVQHTDSIPLFVRQALAQPGSDAPEGDAPDELGAVRDLVVRLAPRTLRMARGLMGSSLDAREAAMQALTELLRGGQRENVRPTGRSVDRVIALSMLRFARAVRRRDDGLPAAHRPRTSRRPLALRAQAARRFEQFLHLLPDGSREILLFRYALGFTLGELSAALRISLPSTRAQLFAARRELRALLRPGGATAPTLGESAQRWCAQRDREAGGDTLSADELSELTAIEARDPEVWAFAAQMRALEGYLDGAGEGDHLDPIERELVERTLLALQVSSPALRRVASFESEEVLEQSLEPRGSRFVRVAALGASTALAAATVVALITHRPHSTRVFVGTPVLLPSELARPAVLGPAVHASHSEPTVEALPLVPVIAAEAARPLTSSSRSRRSRRREASATMIELFDVDAEATSKVDAGSRRSHGERAP